MSGLVAWDCDRIKRPNGRLRQEELDITAIAPGREKRSLGWIDHKQYIAFVQREYDEFVGTTN